MAPLDFAIMLFTFLVTMLYNVEKGMTYGIIASVLILVLQFSKRDLDSLGQMALQQEVRQVKHVKKIGERSTCEASQTCEKDHQREK